MHKTELASVYSDGQNKESTPIERWIGLPPQGACKYLQKHQIPSSKLFTLLNFYGTITQKKVLLTPVDIALQTVKNSGPSERKAVQEEICKYN